MSKLETAYLIRRINSKQLGNKLLQRTIIQKITLLPTPRYILPLRRTLLIQNQTRIKSQYPRQPLLPLRNQRLNALISRIPKRATVEQRTPQLVLSVLWIYPTRRDYIQRESQQRLPLLRLPGLALQVYTIIYSNPRIKPLL